MVKAVERACMWAWFAKTLFTNVASLYVHCFREAGSCIHVAGCVFVPHVFFLTHAHVRVFYNYCIYTTNLRVRMWVAKEGCIHGHCAKGSTLVSFIVSLTLIVSE